MLPARCVVASNRCRSAIRLPIRLIVGRLPSDEGCLDLNGLILEQICTERNPSNKNPTTRELFWWSWPGDGRLERSLRYRRTAVTDRSLNAPSVGNVNRILDLKSGVYSILAWWKQKSIWDFVVSFKVFFFFVMWETRVRGWAPNVLLMGRFRQLIWQSGNGFWIVDTYYILERQHFQIRWCSLSEDVQKIVKEVKFLTKEAASKDSVQLSENSNFQTSQYLQYFKKLFLCSRKLWLNCV